MPSKAMKTESGVTCLKVLLMIFTIIFSVIGLVLFGSGIYSKVKLTSYILLSTIDYSSAPWVMIGFGAFIAVVGFVGCCATYKGNTCLLRSYGTILGVIFIAELAGAIAVIVLRGKISSSFDQGMVDAMLQYKTNNKYKEAVDNAQNTLLCCGASNYTDYWNRANWTVNTVPQSCCKNDTLCKPKKGIVTLPANSSATEYVYDKGCPNSVFNVVDSNLGIVIGSMFGVAFFQVIGVVLACCLATTINSNKYELV